MTSPSSRFGILSRIVAYMVLQGLVLGAYVEVVKQSIEGNLGAMKPEDFLRENRSLEFIQIGVLIAIAALCAASFRPKQPSLHRCLCLLALIAMFRELDSFLKDHLFEDAHWIGVGVCVIGLAFVIWSGRERLRTDVPAFLLRPGFLIMVFGLLLVTVYAQIFGQREIWLAFAPEASREAKRFVEEGLEFMGYLVIGCGVFEERFFGARPTDHS